MGKLLVICGPTATGKTAIGVKLAKEFNGELVSADSRQVYKGMDIGTGKEISNIKYQISKIQIKNRKFFVYKIEDVSVWLWDIVEPDYRFNVANYVRYANLVIKDIWKRKKLPILVGGTGFYIKGIVDGIDTVGIPPDWELRKKLSNYPIIQLSNLLKKIDLEKWKRMNKSDRNNPRRLIRAIEIAEQSQKSKIKYQKYKSNISKACFSLTLKIKNVLFIGLTMSNKILYQKIDKRVDERVKGGIVKEIQDLLKKGYSWDNSVLGETLGYKEFKPYFEGKTNLDEVIQSWKFDEHSYARRQMTWFKKDKRINWFKITEKDFEKNLPKLVKAWYSKKNAQEN